MSISYKIANGYSIGLCGIPQLVNIKVTWEKGKKREVND
jgi:hypothetical protein